MMTCITAVAEIYLVSVLNFLTNKYEANIMYTKMFVVFYYLYLAGNTYLDNSIHLMCFSLLNFIISYELHISSIV